MSKIIEELTKRIIPPILLQIYLYQQKYPVLIFKHKCKNDEFGYFGGVKNTKKIVMYNDRIVIMEKRQICSVH